VDLLGYTIEQVKAFTGGSASSGGGGGDGIGVDSRTIDGVETALSVRFPSDVRPIARVFRGGKLGEKLDHFSWSPDDPINVIERTRHFRAQGLAPDRVALAVAGRILHVMVFHTTQPMIYGYLLTSAEDPTRLEKPIRQQYSISFFSYAGFILDRILTLRYVPVRAAMMKRFATLTPRAARQWRHRWAPHEAVRIHEILKRGIRATDNLPTHVVDGKEYVDLRGYVKPLIVPPGPMSDEPPPPPPWIERVDLSFAEGNFFDTHARDCLFRGARMSCARGRFERCDFTMVDVEHAERQCVGCDFLDCNFTGAYLANCAMFGRYERCDFTGADLWLATPEPSDRGGHMSGCTLADARVSGDFGPWRSWKYGFLLDASDTALFVGFMSDTPPNV
jgi:hypothetical protein